MLFIKLHVFCETNTMDWSKSLMDVILGIRNILYSSGRFLIIHHQKQFLEWHISVYVKCYVFSKTNPSMGSVLIKDIILTPWIRKVPDNLYQEGLWWNFSWGTYECVISNCKYIGLVDKFQNFKNYKKSKKKNISYNYKNFKNI